MPPIPPWGQGTGPSFLTQPCELLVAVATRCQPWGVPPALPDLPRIVTLSEDAAPGARVAEVAVSCSNASSSPHVTLQHVESNASIGSSVTPRNIDPNHPFNPIAISADGVPASTYRAEVRLGGREWGWSMWHPAERHVPTQVTLRAGAELDAHRVNWYMLLLRAACPGEQEVTGKLYVRVTSGQALRCAFPFASAGGDVVQVWADVAPRELLYAVQAQPPGGLTVSANALRPAASQREQTLGTAREWSSDLSSDSSSSQIVALHSH